MKRVGWMLIGAAALLAGCTKSAPPAGPSPGGPSASASGPIRVVFIPKNSGNTYFDAVIAGFKRAGDELGFQFDTVAPDKADATSQIPFIKEQVQRGVSVIAIAPNSPDALKPALKDAMARGVHVITVDSDLTGNEDGREAAVLPADFGKIGDSQLALVSELTGGKGSFAILSATTDAPNQNAWIAAMKKDLAEPKYAGLKLVEVAYGNDDPQKSTSETQGLLTKYPDLKCIDAPTSVGVVAAAQAVETAGAAKRVQVTGLGTPNQMRRFVKDGTARKFEMWIPADMGYVAGCLADGIAKGVIKPAPGGSFKAGSLGDRTFGANNVVITGTPVIFDASNIDQYHF